MSTKTNLLHITIVIPKAEVLHSVRIPNKKTLKVIADAQAGKKLFRAKDAEDLFKKTRDLNLTIKPIF